MGTRSTSQYGLCQNCAPAFLICCLGEDYYRTWADAYHQSAERRLWRNRRHQMFSDSTLSELQFSQEVTQVCVYECSSRTPNCFSEHVQSIVDCTINASFVSKRYNLVVAGHLCCILRCLAQVFRAPMSVCVVMSHVPGCSLEEHCARHYAQHRCGLNPLEAHKILHQIIHALAYMHRMVRYS